MLVSHQSKDQVLPLLLPSLTWLTLLMLLLPRLNLLLPSMLPRLEHMLVSHQSKDQQLTWLTLLMLLLPRPNLQLPLLPLKPANMLLLLPSQLRLSQRQHSQPTLLHSTVDTMVAITTDTTHMLMELTHMLTHAPMNKGSALVASRQKKNSKQQEKQYANLYSH